MPRFVLLRHECPPQFEKPSHWDFMLEWGAVLRTWELRELPRAWADLLGESSSSESSSSDSVNLIPLPDHRLAYLEYEGPLTGGRGSVERCDHGTYEILGESPDQVTVHLEGKFLSGPSRLRRGVEEVWVLDQIDD